MRGWRDYGLLVAGFPIVVQVVVPDGVDRRVELPEPVRPARVHQAPIPLCRAQSEQIVTPHEEVGWLTVVPVGLSLRPRGIAETG